VVLQQPRLTLIGAVSPKGPPSPDGTVEILYGIVGSQAGKGYATEATRALLEWVCKDPRTRRVVAETMATRAASIAVMEKCGLSFLGEGSVPGAIRYVLACQRTK
jgi:[ribosomal protein S5]-alanine N-acetyltransferase